MFKLKSKAQSCNVMQSDFCSTDLGLKIMVEQLYMEKPRGECAKDSAVTARYRSAFATFTGLEHVDNFFGIHAAI